MLAQEGGEAVGAVTSGTWSPTFEKALGMAYVPVALSAPGTPLTLDVRGKALPAVGRCRAVLPPGEVSGQPNGITG